MANFCHFRVHQVMIINLCYLSTKKLSIRSLGRRANYELVIEINLT